MPKFSDYDKLLRTSLPSKYIGHSSKGLLLCLMHLNPPEFQVWKFLLKNYMCLLSQVSSSCLASLQGKDLSFTCSFFLLCLSPMKIPTSISCRIRILSCYCTLLLGSKPKHNPINLDGKVHVGISSWHSLFTQQSTLEITDWWILVYLPFPAYFL